MNKYIKYIGWKITSKCNLNCEFCYSVEDLPTELCLDAIFLGLKKLKKLGIQHINLTGGEPLIRNDILEICTYCKNLDFNVTISSNGILIKSLNTFIDKIDCLSISLDTIKIDDSRKFVHKINNNILSIIKSFDKSIHNFNLKINTLVTKENINEVKQIGAFLNNLSSPVLWKLLKLAPRGKAKKTASIFNVSNKKFFYCVDFCSKKYANIRISSWPIKKTINGAYYILINSDGRITLPLDSTYRVIGSIFDKNLNNIFHNLESRYQQFFKNNNTYFENSYKHLIK